MSGFSEVLVKSVNEALKNLLGESAATAVNFYCDPCILTEDPDRYRESLERMFGIGSEVLLESMVRELYSQIGLSDQDERRVNFTTSVKKAEKTYRIYNRI